ncbi:MAG: hypothetical protein ACI8S6_003562, partial [Myxococcota bacterium]
YGLCFMFLCGCFPFLLPFEFQSVNEAPYIDDAIPALSEEEPRTGTAIVTSLGLRMFVVIKDKNDLTQLGISWRLQSENGSRGEIINSDVRITDGTNQSITSQLSLDLADLQPYDGGLLRIVIEDSYGETATASWTLDVEEPIK